MSYMRGWGFHLRRLRKDYNKLEAENEALKRKLELKDGDLESVKTGFILAHLRGRFEKLKASRDELLQALKYLYDGSKPYPDEAIGEIIEKAEALKDKEAS